MNDVSLDADVLRREEEALKHEDERSSSPKSCTSGSDISCSSSSGSIISESLEFSDNVSDEGAQPDDRLIEDFGQLKVGEEKAEELVREGADMRHVMLSSWKLEPKYRSMGGKSGVKAAPGQALRDMANVQRMSIEEHGLLAKRKTKMNPPPGFEQVYTPLENTLDDQATILVSYADGSNTLSTSDELLCLHNITVSAAVDCGHVFIKQMDNPTHEGLAPLELAMLEAYEEEEAPPVLLRPIANGSLLAVYTDSKWYRCQVVDFNADQDTCDVKFVDHGGYTTVEVSQLRQLRSDFIRLPFQAIEVYLAHIRPASQEIEIDIAADILFRENVSIQMVGVTEDGVPVVQAYFYLNEYIHLFNQDILDDGYRVLLANHPDYVPVSINNSPALSETSGVSTSSSPVPPSTTCSCISPTQFPSLQESLTMSSSPSDWASEPSECASGECTIVTPEESQQPEAVYMSPEEEQQQCNVYPSQYSEQEQQQVAWVPVNPNQPMVAYYVPDPASGVLYYVASPLAPAAPVYQYITEQYVQQQQPVVEEVASVDGFHYLESKPYEEWTQEDYECYYSSQE